MSFVFRGARGDIESGFHNFVPERRAVRLHGGGRPINTNPMVILVTMFLLFMILNSHQVSPNFILWFGMAVFLMGTSLRMYAILCQQIQAHANAAAAAATVGGLFGPTELRLRVPPIAFATRGRLQGLRLQLALLDRDFEDLDYDALRALDPDNPPGVPALSDAEINSLPVHKYKPSASSSSSSSQSSELQGADQQGTSSNQAVSSAEELTCSVCLEQVNEGDLVRSLPCLHQFHPHCIDKWLRQQATCPVCKFKLSTVQPDTESPV